LANVLAVNASPRQMAEVRPCYPISPDAWWYQSLTPEANQRDPGWVFIIRSCTRHIFPLNIMSGCPAAHRYHKAVENRPGQHSSSGESAACRV
jgi:hypothetical protein